MTLVIAEAGVNHIGKLDVALELVGAASKAGADVVKFQTFSAEQLVTRQADKAAYQKKNTKGTRTQFEMLKKLELPLSAYRVLRDFCGTEGIEFLSTAFDISSLMFLVNEVGLNRLKIPSGEITNAPLILSHAHQGKPIILSTGMATVAAIENALTFLALAFLDPGNQRPSIDEAREAYLSPEGQRVLRSNVTLLHCTSDYPARSSDLNLHAITSLRSAFDLAVGYSDHSVGIHTPIAAVALGATVLEKHFTLSTAMHGPDHAASLEPDHLALMVANMKAVKASLGHGRKIPSPRELETAKVARKSLVALQTIREGEKVNETNLGIKRPGTGVSPIFYWEYLGKKATMRYEEDDLIK